MLEWSEDVSAADWIVDRLYPFGPEVGSLVPDGLAAYARLLHPAWRAESGRRVRVRWAELASHAGVGLEVTTRFEALERMAGSRAIEPPGVGTLDEDDLQALVGLLAAFTSTPRSCWFGWWEGYGWMQGSPAVAGLPARLEQDGPAGATERCPPPAPVGPRVELPERPLVLYRGAISDATAFCRPPASQSPNLWWPDDHAWCVASEIDFRSTYLGGSQALIDRVLDDERFEALPARTGDRVTD
jgi:hypothetical protein